MPVLGLPLLLVGLVALPAVAGIYWLRTRFRRQAVSSLMLWEAAAEAQGGGRKKNRLQTPLALLLELLAILLLVLAATAPRVLRAGQTPSVVVVLDDSYSMTAADDRGVSARDRGAELVRRELAGLGRYTVRFVAAGVVPRVLGEAATSSGGAAEVEAVLERWRPEASASDLDAGLALAGEVSGGDGRARVLVVSDRTPQAERDAGEPGEETGGELPSGGEGSTSGGGGLTSGGRVKWLAVGKAGPNVGVVNAVRSAAPGSAASPDTPGSPGSAVGGGDIILLEVANYSEDAATATLTLTAEDGALSGGAGEVLETRRVEVGPGLTERVWVRLGGAGEAASGRAVVATLGDDALAADNRAVLMPAGDEPVAVSVDIADGALGRAVQRAVEASGKAVTSGGTAEAVLTFTDRDARAGGERWVVRFDDGSADAVGGGAGGGSGGGEAGVQAFLGPFVVDYGHPMMEGVSLVGLVWAVPGGASGAGDAAGEGGEGSASPPGDPVVSAGDEVLVSDEARADGSHTVTWRLVPGRSTLLRSASLPVMVWNLIDWRRGELPGLRPSNARPGVPVTVTTAARRGEVRVQRVGSDGEVAGRVETLAVADGRASYVPERPGMYEVTVAADTQDADTPPTRYRFAVNAGSAAESDLTTLSAGVSGRWDDDVAIANEYRSLAWALGLLALAVLGLHGWLLYRSEVSKRAATAKSSGTPTGVPA